MGKKCNGRRKLLSGRVREFGKLGRGFLGYIPLATLLKGQLTTAAAFYGGVDAQ